MIMKNGISGNSNCCLQLGKKLVWAIYKLRLPQMERILFAGRPSGEETKPSREAGSTDFFVEAAGWPSSERGVEKIDDMRRVVYNQPLATSPVLGLDI